MSTFRLRLLVFLRLGNGPYGSITRTLIFNQNFIFGPPCHHSGWWSLAPFVSVARMLDVFGGVSLFLCHTPHSHWDRDSYMWNPFQ